MSQLINVVYLDAHAEYVNDQNSLAATNPHKRIELLLGDVVEARTDVIVCSSSAGLYTFPSGSVIRAIKRYFDISLSATNVIPLRRPQQRYKSGTWIYNDELSSGQSLLITAIPGRTREISFHEGFQKQFDTLIEALHELDQSRLYSEAPSSKPIRVPPPLSVALPILGGNRNYDQGRVMEYIIDQCSSLLRETQHLEVIQLYAYQHAESFKWSKILDSRYRGHQEKYPFKEECADLSKMLQRRIRILSLSPQSQINNLRQEVLYPLYQHLNTPPCILTLSTFARKSWEAVVLSYMDIQVGQKFKSQSNNMFSKFMSLRGHLQEQDMIDAWISLSIVKEFGNGAVHMQGVYHQSSLNANDYPVLLYTLSRVLGLVDPFRDEDYDRLDTFYTHWSQEIEKRLVDLRQYASQHSLDLKSFINEPINTRQTRVLAWLDQVVLMIDPDQQLEYWSDQEDPKRCNASNANDFYGLLGQLAGVLPKWVLIHLYIWNFDQIHWSQGDLEETPIELQMYDLLSRWRLLTFVKQRFGALK